MLYRVGWVQVCVFDMDRSVEFYENSVGIGVRTRTPEFPEFVELATEGTILALNKVGDEQRDLIGHHTGITLTVPDIEAVYRSLSSKGVRFSRPPAKETWGAIMTSFFDPDENEISVLEMPQG